MTWVIGFKLGMEMSMGEKLVVPASYPATGTLMVGVEG
jgi:hypothetical protein